MHVMFCFFFGVLSLVSCAYAVYAAWAVRRFAALSVAETWKCPDIVILKPLHGAEPQLAETLETLFHQDYSGRYSVVFGVSRANDPAIAIVEQLRLRFGEEKVRLVVGSRRHGTNAKVANLIRMSRDLTEEVVVIADSDIAVEPNYLNRLVAALEKPGVGAVTCLYLGRPVAGFWSELAATAIDCHFFPNAIVGLSLGLAKPCFGSTIALRRETLTAIGGFEAIADKLADDHAIGVAVRGLGLKVAVPGFVVRHNSAEPSLDELWSHEMRWARTIRTLDTAGYVGAGITHAVPLALIAAALDGFSPLGWGVLALALASRSWLHFSVLRGFGGSWMAMALGPCRDILSAMVYLSSFVSRSVTWRGESFVVARDGAMTPGAKPTVEQYR
jgi:ceramide glucosyltransferase